MIPYSGDRERVAIEQVVAALHEQLVTDYPVPPARRDAHPKSHGTVQAEFIVSRSIPADLSRGVFSTPGKRYRAYVRFSNCFHIDPDLKADPRGIGVKLLGVIGRQLPGAEGGTQDFLGATADAFFVPDMSTYVGFPEAAARGGMAVPAFFIRHRLWRGLWNLARAALTPAMNPLAISYFSQTPYRLGDHRIIKFQIRPALTEALGESLPWTPGFMARVLLGTFIFYTCQALRLSWLGERLLRVLGHSNLLRRALAASLRKSDAWFEFLVQVREAGMGTEDATERWPPERSPFVRAAWIRVPRQTVSDTLAPIMLDPRGPDDPAAQLEDIGEHLSFNPWNGLDAHEPLGSINRGRARVNAASSRYRHDLNGRPAAPPTPAAFDALAALTRLAPGSIDPRPEPDPFTFGSRWAYLYLRRVPLLTTLAIVAFTLASVYVPRVRMFTGGIFDVPRGALVGVALLSCLLAFTVMTTWWVITAYSDRRSGARRRYSVYPIRPRWYALSLAVVAGPIAWGTTVASGITGRAEAMRVAAIWSGAVLISLAGAWSARWIAEFLADVPFVKKLAGIAARMPSRGAGFLTEGHRTFLPGHSLAFVLAVVSCLAYIAVGGATLQAIEPRFPALVFLLFIPILGCWGLSALTFFLDRTRVPSLTLVALIAAVGATQFDTHTFELREPMADVQATPRDVLLATTTADPAAMTQARPDTAIVIAASGGGLQAAMWTVEAIAGMDRKCRDEGCAFATSVALISGTSGGALGALIAADGFDERGVERDGLVDRTGVSFEDVLWRTLIYRDIFGPLRRLVASHGDDRGRALERIWQHQLRHGATLSDFQRDAREGRRPGLIFTTAYTRSAAPLLISTAGRVTSRTDFVRQYGGRDLALTTGARLSASFPVVVPLPVDDKDIADHRLVDGGTVDLFGVDAALNWLADALPGQSRITRVLLLEIEAPQDAPYSLLFAGRVTDQRHRNLIALRNLQRALGPGFDIREVQLVLHDEPSIAWHLTRGQQQRIADEWARQSSGPAVAAAIAFLK